MCTLRIIYRFTSVVSIPGVPLIDAVSPRDLLSNFIDVFGTATMTVIAENATRSDRDWISSKVTTDILETNYGDDWQTSTFLMAISLCQALPDNQMVYIVDGSFLHTTSARKVMMNGLKLAAYVTGYDDPNKYVNTGVLSDTGTVGGAVIWNASEATRIFCDGEWHYKKTSDTVLCIMSRAKTFKHDSEVFQKLINIPNYSLSNLWHELSLAGHQVICTIPAVSTSSVTSSMAPVTDWSSVIHAKS